MKKNIVFLVLILSILVPKANALPNPWTDCGDDISCGAKSAGFNLPIRVQNYTVRAMKDMLEVTFPLNKIFKKRMVTLRKSQLAQGIEEINGFKDISGIYENYPVNKTIKLNNGVLSNVKGIKNKFYVANFGAETGYYSFYSKSGLNRKDINYFYNLLEEAEAPRYFGQIPTIEQLMDSRRVDDIVEPIFTQDCFPRTLEKRGVTKDCFERVNLGDDRTCSASEIKLIKEYYKKGQDKDPLNDGTGQFCAEEPK